MLRYSEIQEHPCRLCSTCGAASRNLGRGLKIASISAVLVAVIVAISMSQEYEICVGLLLSMLLGLGTFVVAFILIYFGQGKQPYRKAQTKVSAYRELRKGSRPGKYVVLSEERFKDLQKSQALRGRRDGAD